MIRLVSIAVPVSSSSAGEPGVGSGLQVMNSRNSLANASVLRARPAKGVRRHDRKARGTGTVEHPELSRSDGRAQLLSADDAADMVGRRDASFPRHRHRSPSSDVLVCRIGRA
jgi:hypothetical protein